MTSTNNKPFFKASNSGDTSIRQGILDFKGTPVKTPTFMAVGTRGAIKGLTTHQVSLTGVQILLGNTYHLNMAPGPDLVARLGGLAAMNKWHGPTLTDSGGFQVFSLSGVRKITEEGVNFTNPSSGDKMFISPEISMQIQHKLGADIIMAFDDVVGQDKDSRHRTLEAMDRTHRWLDRSIAEHNKLSKAKGSKKPKLFGIVQGGLDEKLRKKSLDYIQSTDVEGVAIGGLAVGEARTEMFKMLSYLQPLYDESRPHYLMGVGHPIDMRFAIEHGIDMFDCVLPTRNGRHGSFWTYEKGKDVQHNIKRNGFGSDDKVLEPGCDCYTCAEGYSRSYLRHLIKAGETVGGSMLGLHNIRYLMRLCEQYQSN